MLQRGEWLSAYDTASEALKRWPEDSGLRQLLSLSLICTGATDTAWKILETLSREEPADEETLGILARIFKDLSARAFDRRASHRLMRKAFRLYDRSYRLHGGYWAGINAATTALVTGHQAKAESLAYEVKNLCLQASKSRRGDSYWVLATLGEASLVLRDFDSAVSWFKRARSRAGKRLGDIGSTRRNARLLLKHWKAEPSAVEAVLRVPGVVVFSGHMIDESGRRKPRFPASLEAAVKNQIRAKLQLIQPGVGFSSAANGSDILFLETMLESGAEIVVVLPYERAQFVEDSVAKTSSKVAWTERFERVIGAATRVITASPEPFYAAGISYDYANRLLLGLAKIRAQQLETSLTAMTVWDASDDSRADGGTATAVDRWRRAQVPVEVLSLSTLRQIRRSPVTADLKTETLRKQKPPAATNSQIVALLFADAVGFSRLTEHEIPAFTRHFLGMIANLTRKSPRAILAKNTWGDGLYLVFSDVQAAGEFALQLCELAATARWHDLGLPAGLALRVGLHAGPVHRLNDPVTGRRSYCGTHVNRAARIEPITPPGSVYASESFAALAAATQSTSLNLDYVGQTPLSKEYGVFPTYLVRRRQFKVPSPALATRGANNANAPSRFLKSG